MYELIYFGLIIILGLFSNAKGRTDLLCVDLYCVNGFFCRISVYSLLLLEVFLLTNGIKLCGKVRFHDALKCLSV